MYITGWNVSSLWLASTAASIATFILYISLNGQLIEPGKVFTAVATFSILQEPIRVFPEALMAITQALVSVQRLKNFMQSDELQDDAVEQQVYVPGLEADMVAAVCVENGCFKWELERTSSQSASTTRKKDPLKLIDEEEGAKGLVSPKFCYQPNAPLVLKGITLLIQDGEKVGVVGWTGSGKSTLIQALFRLVEAD
ncbi:unnamed protein product [Sphagnum balticum]